MTRCAPNWWRAWGDTMLWSRGHVTPLWKPAVPLVPPTQTPTPLLWPVYHPRPVVGPVPRHGMGFGTNRWLLSVLTWMGMMVMTECRAQLGYEDNNCSSSSVTIIHINNNCNLDKYGSNIDNKENTPMAHAWTNTHTHKHTHIYEISYKTKSKQRESRNIYSFSAQSIIKHNILMLFYQELDDRQFRFSCFNSTETPFVLIVFNFISHVLCIFVCFCNCTPLDLWTQPCFFIVFSA